MYSLIPVIFVQLLLLTVFVINLISILFLLIYFSDNFIFQVHSDVKTQYNKFL